MQSPEESVPSTFNSQGALRFGPSERRAISRIRVVAIIAVISISAVVGLLFAYTRNQLPSCGQNHTFFSVLPVSQNETKSLVPLGQVTPPDHVFPAPHNYIYIIDPQNPQNKHASVYSPGDLTLVQLGIRHYNVFGNVTNFTDYTLVFQPCSEFSMYFHHVTTLSYAPFVKAAQQIIQTCHFSTTINEDFCSGEVNIPIMAGDLIGTAGDLAAGAFGMDIGARDSRLQTGKSALIDPSKACLLGRCYTVCAFDYFTAEIRNRLRFTDPFGTVTRTQQPTCGTVYHDVAGSLQGYWYNSTNARSSISPEAEFLFLGPDSIEPSMQIVSIGVGASTISPGKYLFQPTNSGLVNLNLSVATRGGTVYCYETTMQPGASYGALNSPISVILIQLVDSNTARIEKINSNSCGNGPWQLDSSYTDFVR